MKKIFIGMLVCMFSVINAFAAEYKTSDGFTCAKTETFAGTPDAKITLFFDTARGTGGNAGIGLHNGCSDVNNTLFGRYQNVAGVVVIGAADLQNASGNYDNDALSRRRGNYAASGFPSMSELDTWAAGNINANQPTANQDNRVAVLYVFFEHHSHHCNDDMIKKYNDSKTALQSALGSKKLSDADKKRAQDALENVNSALEICNEAGKLLTKDEVDKLLKYMDVVVLNLSGAESSALIGITANINISQSTSYIDQYYAKIKSEMDAQRNVWRDADGNFNTARLASDSIAGVVLGTAGGIITANVVKKNQLKKGFEDIKCAIAGQNVASFGDTMRASR